MRALLSIFIAVLMFFAGVTESYAFGKSKAKNAPTPTVESSADNTSSSVNSTQKTKKAKKTKTKKEKVKKNKTKTQETINNENITSDSSVASSTKKEKRAKKEKKSKKDKAAPQQTKATTQTTAEKEKKKRTFIGRFLNPNLDIYEIRASHILVKKRKDAVSIRKDILNGDITFEEAAKRYSLCPTGPYGGDLGYFNRRKMDQLFTDIAFDLKIGEISDPVGTKFGWHLIKVVDKR